MDKIMSKRKWIGWVIGLFISIGITISFQVIMKYPLPTWIAAANGFICCVVGMYIAERKLK